VEGAAPPGPRRLVPTDVVAWWSDRSHGDQRDVAALGPPAPVPAGAALWVLHQVHGTAVVTVPAGAAAGRPAPAVPGRARRPGPSAPEGDALVSGVPGTVLVVRTADCAPVALGAASGAFAAVHAGWRGVLHGVVGAAADAVRALGPGPLVAGIGPSIGPCCYQFSPADLDTVAATWGPAVRARTRGGGPALDLRAAVRAALDAAGVTLVTEDDTCTACSGRHFSHRAHGDVARQAMFVWRDVPRRDR